VDKTPWEIVPMLADRGIYIASESSFYKVLREQQLLAHRLNSNPPKHERPKELIAHAPNQVWSWDITYLKSPVLGMFYYLYMVVDIYSRKIIDWEIRDRESVETSSMLLARACQQEGVEKDQLFLHSDNGGPMKGATMLATLQKLGVVASFSRPKVSDDNPYSESLFRTLKYRPTYPTRAFKSIEDAVIWVEGFVQWYNYEHLHSGIRFVTPASRHALQDQAILERRALTYSEARRKNPARWIKKTRNWDPVLSVVLNRLKKTAESDIKLSA
jgi:putative transposase